MQRIRQWLQPYWHFLFLGSVFAAVYHRWLFEQSILTHGDWHYFTPESLRFSRLYYFSTWLSDFGLGREMIDVGQAPTYGLYGLLNLWFNFNFEMASRAVHLWPIVILTPVAGYLLSGLMTQKKLIRVAGTLVYAANTYFLILQTGHVTLMAAFNFAVFAFLAYFYGLEKKQLSWLLASGLLLSIASAYETRVFYIGALLIAFYGAYSLPSFFEQKKLSKKIWRFLSLGVPFIVALPLNLYWILPVYASGLLASNEFFNRVLFGNEFMNMSHAIALFHPFWTGGTYLPFIVHKIPFHLWLVPIVAMVGLYVKRIDKKVFFFGCVALLGIFLTKQSGSPFELVYNWLYLHVPGFNAFREATKFYFLTAIGYTVLSVTALEVVWQHAEKSGQKIWKFFIVALCIVLIFTQLINFKPLLTGEIGTLFTPRHIPEDYLHWNKTIVNDSDFYRVLWVPTYSRWSVFTQNHPKLSLVDLLAGNWNQFVAFNRVGEAFPTEKHILQFFDNHVVPYLFDSSSIKYVIVPPIDTANDDNFYQYYGNRDVFISELKKTSLLKADYE